jgi:hypothetical protein
VSLDPVSAPHSRAHECESQPAQTPHLLGAHSTARRPLPCARASQRQPPIDEERPLIAVSIRSRSGDRVRPAGRHR